MADSPRPDVAYWLNLEPRKRGSLEDFLAVLAGAARERGLSLVCVTGPQIAPPVEELFAAAGLSRLSYDPAQAKLPSYRYRFLQALRPRLVHYRFMGVVPPDAGFGKVLGHKVLIADHSSRPARPAPPGPLGPAKRLRRRLIAGLADGYLAVSDFVAGCLQSEAGIPRAKISVIPNGVDLARFAPPSEEARAELRRKLMGLGPERVVVIYVGQMNADKGVDLLLQAAPELTRRHPDLSLVMAGDGALSGQAGELARELGGQRLVYLGLRDDVDALLKASDVMTAPSVWQEAFGLTLAEAQATGLPVVASRIGGIPEVVASGETAILTPPGEARALAAALEELIADAARRRLMGRAAREHAERRLDVARAARDTAALYARLLGR